MRDETSHEAQQTGLVALERLSGSDGEEAWAAVAARLEGRPFLRSEGMGADLAAPRQATPALVAQSRELVRRFDRYYRAIVDAEGALANEPARLIGEPYEEIAALEGARAPLPLGRFDCVLERDGTLRVIELNPIGVCTLHLRAVSYLARVLARMSDVRLHGVAQAIDELRALKVASIRRYVDSTLARAPTRPSLGLVLIPGLHRGTQLLWRRELADAGFDVALGTPDEVRVRDGHAHLGDRRVDALWVDWFLYLGYQQTRYAQTHFPSKMGDFSKAAEAARRLLTLPGLAAKIADRSLTLLSPLRGYRALSKALLAWIDRPALAIPEEDRAWLHAHVARTYDHHARQAASLDELRRQRELLVLKPCRFGGSHGVVIGREVDAEAWARRLDETWTDPEWVLQAYADPVTDADGARLSYGLYSYDGELGGLLVRGAPGLLVSARTAEIIVAVMA